MTTPAGPPSASALGKCVDCGIAKACVSCCGEQLCLMHAHCTRHAQHPMMWKVIDRAEYAATLDAVTLLRAGVVAELEEDLAKAERQLQEQTEALLPQKRKREETGAAALAKPSLPTFGSIRERAMKQAERVGVRATLAFAHTGLDTKSEELETGDPDTDPCARRMPRSEILFKINHSGTPASGASQAVTSQADGSVEEMSSNAHDASSHAVSEEVNSAAASRGPSSVAQSVEGDGASAPEGLRATVCDVIFRALQDGCVHDAAAQRSLTSSLASSSVDDLIAREQGRAFTEMKPGALHVLAASIETAAFDSTGGVLSKEYRERVRALSTALREGRNRELRARVLSGDLSASALAVLPDSDLASAAFKEERRKIEERDAMPIDFGLWFPSGAPCPRCSSLTTEYMPLSSMRDIRKAEVWGSSDMADNTLYRLRCQQCGNSWEKDNI